jgi:hypothetical protein
MAASFPGAIKSFVDRTDAVHDVMAADVNDAYAEITAVETELGVDPAGTAADLVTRLARSLSGSGNLDFATATTLTITGGAVTPTQNWHLVDTQSAAATDDLDTITATNATDGFMLFLRQVHDDRDVTIKHDSGNIKCPGGVDVVLTDSTQVVVLVYDGTNSKWLVVSALANLMYTNKGNVITAKQVYQAGLRYNLTSITANTTLTTAHHMIDADATSGSIVVTLPTAASISGTEYGFRKSDSGSSVVRIDGYGTEKINGDATVDISTQYETMVIQSDGTNWIILPKTAASSGSGAGAPTDSQYVTLANDGDLSQERVLTAGSGITLTDSGAGGTVTVALSAGGWIPANETWTYVSSASPSYTFGTTVDASGVYSPGMRAKYTDSGSTMYGLMTAVSGSQVTVYGGTDYSMSGSTITNPYYSMVKAPQGFPLDPAKWTQTMSWDYDETISSPCAVTTYDLVGSGSAIALPVGAWDMVFSVSYFDVTGTTTSNAFNSIKIYFSVKDVDLLEKSIRIGAADAVKLGDAGFLASVTTSAAEGETVKPTLFNLNTTTDSVYISTPALTATSAYL